MYAIINKTGCGVRKGNCQIRLDFYLDETDPRYDDKHLYLVDVTSSEYLVGYPGKVDKEGNPVDQEDYDLWLESLPHVWQNTPFHAHFIYLPSTFTQDDIKAAIDIHLKNFYQAFQDRWDEVKGGMRHGWATETRIKPTNYSKIETIAEYDARVADCQLAIDALTPFVYEPKEGGGGKTYPATEIDIGAAASDRAGSWDLNSYTTVEGSNPANGTGTIEDYEIWLLFSDNPDVWLGTFSASGNVLTCRDSESIGNIAAGSKQTGSGLDIDCTSGDYFGVHAKTVGGLTKLEKDATGYTHVWYYTGECIDPSDSQTFTQLADDQISLYGTGETAVAGWTNISHNKGVASASISHKKGVAVASISHVKGVAV